MGKETTGGIRTEHLQRVNVVGCSGTGKSTFARKLAGVLDVPYIEMDRLFWGANWAQTSDEVFFARLEFALRDPKWILDGNYSRTQMIKWKYATLIVWIDFSFPRNLYQSVKRALLRALSHEELWPGTGNRESIGRGFFSRESVILWMMQNHHKTRARYEKMEKGENEFQIPMVRLRSPKELDLFLSHVGEIKNTPSSGSQNLR